VGQVAGVWYIVDDATKTAVYRFPEGAEKWQAREDVIITNETTGITDTHEGWITDEGSMEVTTGEIAQMDYVRFSKLENRNINTMTIQPGYVEKYKVVEITDGTAKLDLLFLDMKYFLKNDKTLTVSYLADKKIVERGGFDVRTSLGKPYYSRFNIPIGDSFSQSDIENGIRFYGLSELAAKFRYFGDGSWMKASKLLNEFQNPSGDYLDLIFETSVDLFFQN
jgi:hypothetical protein